MAAEAGRDFIRDIVQADLDSKKHSQIVTRFPPEPNGYLHIGHAKSIALNFGIAQEFAGRCHLRFDDTNPTKEEQEYIDSDPGRRALARLRLGQPTSIMPRTISSGCYEWAEGLIKAGHAYVDDQSQEEIRVYARHADRARQELARSATAPVEENLDLFRRMKAGEFPNGARVLRAKIDMASGNINLRDPVLYRILHATIRAPATNGRSIRATTTRTASPDAIEGITHSICTLEFEDHRPLYEWLLDKLPVPSKPRQYEFARLNLTYTLLSKRVLTAARARRPCRRLGRSAHADDRRIEAARRAAGGGPRIRQAHRRRKGQQRGRCRHAGILHPRSSSTSTALRRMAVLRPLKVVIENYPEGQSEELEAVNHPDDPAAGTRKHRVRPRALYRARRFHGKSAEEILPPVAGHRSAAALRLFHQMHRASSRTRPARSSSCAAPTIPRPGAATRPTAARSRRPCTGCRRRSRCRPKSASTIQLFCKPNPDAANFAADLNPQSLEILHGRADRAGDRGRAIRPR